MTNPRLSERHASMLADDRARTDYLNQKAIFGQFVCAEFESRTPEAVKERPFCKVFPTRGLTDGKKLKG